MWWLGLVAADIMEERWQLGSGKRGEGDGAGREERETLEREERDRETLRLFFLFYYNDYSASIFIVPSRVASKVNYLIYSHLLLFFPLLYLSLIWTDDDGDGGRVAALDGDTVDITPPSSISATSRWIICHVGALSSGSVLMTVASFISGLVELGELRRPAPCPPIPAAPA